ASPAPSSAQIGGLHPAAPPIGCALCGGSIPQIVPEQYQVIVLHPPAFINSHALKIGDTSLVVGSAWNQHAIADERALLWTGAGTQIVSLNPGASATSTAFAIDGTQIGGEGGTPHTPQTAPAPPPAA